MIRGPSQLSQQTGAGGIISGLIGEDYPGSGCQMSPGRGLVETQTGTLATLAQDGGLVETQTRGERGSCHHIGRVNPGIIARLPRLRHLTFSAGITHRLGQIICPDYYCYQHFYFHLHINTNIKAL